MRDSLTKVEFFDRSHEPVDSATAIGAFYAIKTVQKPGHYEGMRINNRERTAWLLSDPTTRMVGPTLKLRRWIDSQP